MIHPLRVLHQVDLGSNDTFAISQLRLIKQAMFLGIPMAPSAALAVINTSSSSSKKLESFSRIFPALVNPKRHPRVPTEEWRVTLNWSGFLGLGGTMIRDQRNLSLC